MVFSPSKIPTNMYQLAFALGSQIINKPTKKPKPEKAKYVLFYTDGDRLYEFPLVCLYNHHISHPIAFAHLLQEDWVPEAFTLISSKHPLTSQLRDRYSPQRIRNVHEANRIMSSRR